MDGTLLNMKLCPSLVDKPGGMMKFRQLVETYFDKGGQEVQFNILDKEKLLDAQKRPENYRDLVVRVAGYSAFWVTWKPRCKMRSSGEPSTPCNARGRFFTGDLHKNQSTLVSAGRALFGVRPALYVSLEDKTK